MLQCNQISQGLLEGACGESHALYLNDHQISGPFPEKSEAWADANAVLLGSSLPLMNRRAGFELQDSAGSGPKESVRFKVPTADQRHDHSMMNA